MTEATVAQALAPAACHFCKGETRATTLHAAGISWAQVECLNDDCGATGPCRDTEAEAIAAWNTRTAASQAADAGEENYADAFLVEWVRDGETWVEAHADEVRAADQARKHGVKHIPLYRSPPTSGEEMRLREALEPFARVARINYPLAADWSDDRHNSNFMPSAWPDWGDFKRADEAFSANGGDE